MNITYGRSALCCRGHCFCPFSHAEFIDGLHKELINGTTSEAQQWVTGHVGGHIQSVPISKLSMVMQTVESYWRPSVHPWRRPGEADRWSWGRNHAQVRGGRWRNSVISAYCIKTQCLKIIQNVAFKFFNLGAFQFSPIFVLLKTTCLVTLFDHKLLVFGKPTKLTIFGIFYQLLSTQNVKVARFARIVAWDFFLWFSNTV